jgi:simple sugar transport system permease protein
MLLSGALHGLAGATALLGTYHRAVKGFSLGTGWNAIAIALIARNRPLAVIPAALLYAWLDAGARTATVLAGVSYEMILLVQAVIFYLVTAQALAEFVLARSRAWSMQPSA